MARRLGPWLFLLLLLLAIALRWQEGTHAEKLLSGEARASATLAALHQACRSLVADGRPHPDLGRRALEAVPALRPLPELSGGLVAYAADDVYVFGVVPQTQRAEAGGRTQSGWILRAWPLRFGTTGDREYQIGDDGVLWEGQNRLGRSGTDHGFPPVFPEPEIGLPRAPWWQVKLPVQR